MALIIMEGFDHVTLSGHLAGKWDAASFSAVNAGRFGGSAAAFNSGGHYLTKNPGDPGTTNALIVGMSWKINSAQNTNVITFFDGTSEMGAVEVQTDGTFRYMVGAAELLESTASFTFGSWVYLEVKVLFSNTVGTVAFKVDGVDAGSVSGADTLNAGTACDKINILGTGSFPTSLDDVYIGDTTSGFDFLSSGGNVPRITTKVPNADSTSQFTPLSSTNVSQVDDPTLPDMDTTYNYSITPTHRDMFDFATFSIDAGANIYGVGINTSAVKNDLGNVEIKNVSISNATTGLSAAQAVAGRGLAGFYFVYYSQQNLNPDGAVAWDETTIDAATFGYERQ